MGMIQVSTWGSFRPHQDKQFCAIEHGHARAVADAIRWLSEVVLPDAIKQDHDLHSEGAKPDKGFGKEVPPCPK